MNLFPAIHSFAPRVVNFKEFFYLKRKMSSYTCVYDFRCILYENVPSPKSFRLKSNTCQTIYMHIIMYVVESNYPGCSDFP